MAKTPATDDQAFDLLAWINTGTIARRTVNIYIDHEAFSECSRLYDELEALGWSTDEPVTRAPDASLIDTTDAQIAALEAELEPWQERLLASKMTWTVRAVSREEIDESFKAVPAPKAPAAPGEHASQQVRDKWRDKLDAFNLARAKADEKRRLWTIAAAVESVATTAGSRDCVTVEELEALLRRPHGAQWIEKLSDAIGEATTEEAEPQVPTLPGS